MRIEVDLIHRQVPEIQQTKPINDVVLHANMFTVY
jgi:hypothetical protein